MFWALFMVFITVSPMAVLYARGYRFDIAKKRFVSTGAIFIKSEPSGAVISINGVRRGITASPFQDALTKPGLIANIIPGEYDIRVERTGYKPWVKKLLVRAREVTEARNIFLFPEGNEPKTLYFTTPEDVLISPDGSLAAVASRSDATSWIAIIDTTTRQSDTAFAITEEKNRRGVYSQTALTLHRFFDNNRKLVVEARRGGTVLNMRQIDLRNPANSLAVSATSLKPAIAGGNPLLFADENLVLWKDADYALWEWPYRQNLPQQLITASAWTVAIGGGNIITIEGVPPLLASRPIGQISSRQLAVDPFTDAADGMPVFSVEPAGRRYAVLIAPPNAQSGTVWLVDEDGRRQMLREHVTAISRSPDGKKLLMRSMHELWIYYLDDVLVQPIHKRGEQMLVARFGTRIKDARWHPASNDYIFYVITEGLFAIELDDRGSVRNNAQLVRDGTVRVEHITEEAAFIIMQNRLARFNLTPDPKVAPVPGEIK